MILQRSLLPESLPEVRGTASSPPATSPRRPGLEVGGDWYEVVAVRRRHVGLTIGDVAGRGIRAASIMGRVRPALRGLVADGHPPAEAMRAPRRLIKEAERPEMTTVFHLHYDPGDAARRVRARRPSAGAAAAPGRARRGARAAAGPPPLGILDGIGFHGRPRRGPAPEACCCSTPTG